MENFPFAFADIIIAIVMLVSAFLAYMRGLVREVLAVGAWVGAAFSALYGFAFIKPHVQTVISHELIANIVTGVSIFVSSLILLSIFSHAISKSVKGSALSALDRALGCVFGLARGAILTCLIYLGAVWIWTIDELPDAILRAQSLSVVQSGAEMLLALAPTRTTRTTTTTMTTTTTGRRRSGSGSIAPPPGLAARSREALTWKLNTRLRALTNPQPQSDEKATGNSQPAYNKNERKDMQRLIESNK